MVLKEGRAKMILNRKLHKADQAIGSAFLQLYRSEKYDNIAFVVEEQYNRSNLAFEFRHLSDVSLDAVDRYLDHIDALLGINT